MIHFLRSFRVGPFAVFDFVMSYVIMYFVAPYLSKFFALFGVYINREQWLWLTLPIALLTHIILRTNTPFVRMFLSPTGGWTAKLVILFMLILAYKS